MNLKKYWLAAIYRRHSLTAGASPWHVLRLSSGYESVSHSCKLDDHTIHHPPLSSLPLGREQGKGEEERNILTSKGSEGKKMGGKQPLSTTPARGASIGGSQQLLCHEQFQHHRQGQRSKMPYTDVGWMGCTSAILALALQGSMPGILGTSVHQTKPLQGESNFCPPNEASVRRVESDEHPTV